MLEENEYRRIVESKRTYWAILCSHSPHFENCVGVREVRAHLRVDFIGYN